MVICFVALAMAIANLILNVYVIRRPEFEDKLVRVAMFEPSLAVVLGCYVAALYFTVAFKKNRQPKVSVIRLSCNNRMELVVV
jgi:multisubunit Na+/H+ antiporter MnhF subunit